MYSLVLVPDSRPAKLVLWLLKCKELFFYEALDAINPGTVLVVKGETLCICKQVMFALSANGPLTFTRPDPIVEKEGTQQTNPFF